MPDPDPHRRSPRPRPAGATHLVHGPTVSNGPGAHGTWSSGSGCSSPSAAPACAGTTSWPSPPGRRSSATSCPATASPTGRRPPGGFLLDQPLQHDSPALQPRLRAAPRVGEPAPSTPGPTWPRGQRDRSTGGTSEHGDENGVGADACGPVDRPERQHDAREGPGAGRGPTEATPASAR